MSNYDDAYAAGFCKAAMAMGVNPRRLAVHTAIVDAAMAKRAEAAALTKSAGGGIPFGLAGRQLGYIARGAGSMARAVGRYGQLLGGGSRARLGPQAIRMDYMRRNGSGLTGRAREYMRGLSGHYADARAHNIAELEAMHGDPRLATIAERYLPGEKALLTREQAATAEMRKALATQLGTAGALGAGAAYDMHRKGYF